MRYYHHHMIIAFIMNLLAVMVGWYFLGFGDYLIWLSLFGGVFYGIREGFQYLQKDWWDSNGFWYPVITSLSMFCLMTGFTQWL